MSVTAPLEPEDVVSDTAFPDIALEIVMVPLDVSDKVPLVDETLPLVPMVADPPVVVTEKLPPTDEVPRVTAPLLDMKAVPVPPTVAVSVPACVSIGVPTVPTVPLPDNRLTVVPEAVNAPERLMLPVPLAFNVVVVPPPTLALKLMLPLLLVASVIDPPPDTVTAAETFTLVPPVIDTVVLPPLTLPVSTVPSAVTVKVRVPSVIVCPAAV